MGRDEAIVAFGVVLRHSVPVESVDPHKPRMVLVPLPELLHVLRHPNISMAAPLHMVRSPTSQSKKTLALIARKDMVAGEEVLPLWLGRFSSSELALKRDTWYSHNPVGVGGRLQLPENWSPNRNTPHNREYRKYNCSSPEAFEMRFSPRGWPLRPFIR